MARKFEGTIAVDIRKSEQDWDAFTQPNPRGAPNVVILLWDDTGIGTWDFYGGRVKMPNMQRNVDQGIRYTQFHTTALCSPTRAALLTGCYPNRLGISGALGPQNTHGLHEDEVIEAVTICLIAGGSILWAWRIKASDVIEP